MGRVHWIYKLIVLSVFTAMMLTLIWMMLDIRAGAENPVKYWPLFAGCLFGYWSGWFERDS